MAKNINSSKKKLTYFLLFPLIFIIFPIISYANSNIEVTLISPNGGETWNATHNVVYRVNFNANLKNALKSSKRDNLPIKYVHIDLSLDNGKTYNNLKASYGGGSVKDGDTFTTSVDVSGKISSSQSRIKVTFATEYVSYELPLYSNSDISDNVFTISTSNSKDDDSGNKDDNTGGGPNKPSPVSGKVIPPKTGCYVGIYMPRSSRTSDIEAFKNKTGMKSAIYYREYWYFDYHDTQDSRESFGEINTKYLRDNNIVLAICLKQSTNEGTVKNIMRKIVEGGSYNGRDLDNYFVNFAKKIKDSGLHVMIENFCEYNSSWQGYKDPELQRKVHRHIVDIFNELGVTNVTWFMHSGSGWPPFPPAEGSDETPMDYYPGDNYLDWQGASFYYRRGDHWDKDPDGIATHALSNFCKKLTVIKPIFLPEYHAYKYQPAGELRTGFTFTSPSRKPLIEGNLGKDRKEVKHGQMKNIRLDFPNVKALTWCEFNWFADWKPTDGTTNDRRFDETGVLGANGEDEVQIWKDVVTNDSYYVKNCEFSTDTTPPSMITDLKAEYSLQDDKVVTLTFTAPGDDGGTGQASYYIIKYSPKPIVAIKPSIGSSQKIYGYTDEYKKSPEATDSNFAYFSSDECREIAQNTEGIYLDIRRDRYKVIKDWKWSGNKQELTEVNRLIPSSPGSSETITIKATNQSLKDYYFAIVTVDEVDANGYSMHYTSPLSNVAKAGKLNIYGDKKGLLEYSFSSGFGNVKDGTVGRAGSFGFLFEYIKPSGWGIQTGFSLTGFYRWDQSYLYRPYGYELDVKYYSPTIIRYHFLDSTNKVCCYIGLGVSLFNYFYEDTLGREIRGTIPYPVYNVGIELFSQKEVGISYKKRVGKGIFSKRKSYFKVCRILLDIKYFQGKNLCEFDTDTLVFSIINTFSIQDIKIPLKIEKLLQNLSDKINIFE